ncbi:hypothetical protein NCTGTJJY_CDS0111 [Serratia phage 92A1]|nr:hypothetical protein NCTGTJJY_CDS0111 [Serratia phage 92A1]
MTKWITVFVMALVIATMMSCSETMSRAQNKAIDETRLCTIKAAEFQKNFVMHEGKCYLESGK